MAIMRVGLSAPSTQPIIHTHTNTHTTHAHTPQGNFLPGRSDNGDYKGQIVALSVLSSRGFEFHAHQLHGNTKRLKPGW